jgi:hypothetical protein
MIITTYHIENIDDYEDFLNKLYKGLLHYRKNVPYLKYKLSYDGTTITLTTMKEDAESLN